MSSQLISCSYFTTERLYICVVESEAFQRLGPEICHMFELRPFILVRNAQYLGVSLARYLCDGLYRQTAIPL